MKKRIGGKPLRENPRVRAATRNQVNQLFTYGAVKTGLIQARSLKQVADKLISAAKKTDLASLRLLVSKMGSSDTARKVLAYIKHTGKRMGSYVTVKKVGMQRGDNRIIARIELLDYKVETKKDEKKQITREQINKEPVKQKAEKVVQKKSKKNA